MAVITLSTISVRRYGDATHEWQEIGLLCQVDSAERGSADIAWIVRRESTKPFGRNVRERRRRRRRAY